MDEVFTEIGDRFTVEFEGKTIENIKTNFSINNRHKTVTFNFTDGSSLLVDMSIGYYIDEPEIIYVDMEKTVITTTTKKERF